MAESQAERWLVVLGCNPGTGVLEGAAKRRVLAAAAAFSAAAEATLVVCSGGRAWNGIVEADAFARALEALGVPRALLVRERCSMTTLDNARYVAALWSRRRECTGIAAKVHVVTCGWHMPRAERHFRAAGLVVSPVPAHVPDGPLPNVLRDGFFSIRERAAAFLDEVAR